MKKKRVLILGASGSIGRSTLKVLRKYRDSFSLSGITVNGSKNEMEKICDEFSLNTYGINSEGFVSLKGKRADIGKMDVNTFLSANAEYDIMVNALVGSVGFPPTAEAIKRGKVVALANKETIVAYGAIIKRLLSKNPESEIRPVDSEHSALWQLIESVRIDDVERAVITASGGVLFRKSIDNPTLDEILDHPVWSMGRKVTVDSSTMVNKGLEVIEAHYLFSLPVGKIGVLIHPQSVVHAMLEMKDGTVLSHMAEPDMVLPVSYALFYPERCPEKQIKLIDYSKGRTLEFYPVDHIKFPALSLAYKALKLGGTFPAVFNASNEAAVGMFLNGRTEFRKIVSSIEKCMKANKSPRAVTAASISAAEEWAKEYTKRSLSEK